MKFYDEASESCKSCPIDCKRCLIDNDCLECEAGKYKYNGICLDDALIIGKPGLI